MLHINEAYNFFEEFSKPNGRFITLGTNENYVHKIKSVIISNSIDKSFGRQYFRTRIELVANFSLDYYWSYISYQIPTHKKNDDLIKECLIIEKEQIKDIQKLSTCIKKFFPNTSIHITIMGHDFLFFYDNIYANHIQLTGNPIIEVLHKMDKKTQFYFNQLKEHQKYHRNKYNECKASAKVFRQKQKQEKVKHREYLAHVREVHEEEMKRNFKPNECLSKLEQQLKNLKNRNLF